MLWRGMGRRKGAAGLMQRFLPQSSDRRVARQTFWMGAITAAQLLGGLAQMSLSARILGPEGFGILAVVVAAASLLFGLTTVPGEEVITTHVTRSIAAGRREEAGQVLRLALGAALGMRLLTYGLIAAGTLAAAGPLGLVAGEYAGAMLLYSLTGVLTGMSGESVAALRLADRLPPGFAVVVVSALAGVGALVWAWLAGGGLLAVIMASVVKGAALGVGLAALTALSAGRAGAPGLLRALSVRVPRDVLRFQIAAFGRSAVEALHMHADALLIAAVAGPAPVGLYRAARYIVDATRLPFLALAQGVQVEYSRQWFGAEGAALRQLARRAAALAIIAAALGYGLLLIFRQPVINLFLGPEFAQAEGSLLIMTVGALAFAGVAAVYVLPAAAGRAGPHLAAMAAAVAAQAGAILLLTPGRGAEGAAWAVVVHYVVFAAAIVPFAVAVLRQSRRLALPPPGTP